MKLQHIVAAVAMVAAGAANASVDQFTTGNGSLFLIAFDNAGGTYTTTSMFVDLGYNLNDFKNGADLTANGQKVVWDFGANTVKVNGTLASTGATYAYSPYITQNFNYGAGYSFNTATGAITEAAATTLVTSPITAACFACHDNTQSVAHMRGNGGSIYATRSAALGTLETCMVCHDTGRIADIKVMHAK